MVAFLMRIIHPKTCPGDPDVTKVNLKSIRIEAHITTLSRTSGQYSTAAPDVADDVRHIGRFRH